MKDGLDIENRIERNVRILAEQEKALVRTIHDLRNELLSLGFIVELIRKMPKGGTHRLHKLMELAQASVGRMIRALDELAESRRKRNCS